MYQKGFQLQVLVPLSNVFCTKIYKDGGDFDSNVKKWHCLDGDIWDIPPWMVLPHRPLRCEFVNTHNDVIQEVLNFNMKVQIGDPSQIIYKALYDNKSTQGDDAEKARCISHYACCRLLKSQDEIDTGLKTLDDEDLFVKGLCRLLSGINAATSRDVVSPTIAHLLISNGGTGFRFS